MANPSNVSMFIRLVGGNVSTPYPSASDNNEHKISGHDFLAALQVWDNGEITKIDLVNSYNLTHANDSGDLDDLKGWYDSATKQDKFVQVLEQRIVLARDKRSSFGRDGRFGYAVKATFINGIDGDHSLEDDGPAPAQFNSWA